MGCVNTKKDMPLTEHATSGGDGDEKRIELAFKTKRQNVFTAGVSLEDSTFTPRNIPKTDIQRSIISAALDQNFIFNNIGDIERGLLINAMEMVEYGAAANIITQGEEGDYFYVVERGSLTIFVNDVPVGILGDGKSFGELALIYNTPRQATIRTDSQVRLFALDRNTFRYTLARSSSDKSANIQTALSKVSLLSGLTKLQIAKISEAVEIIKYEAGNVIIKKGTEGNIFYMIKEGKVKVTEVGSGTAFNDHILEPGQYFGERALITGEPRAANVIAETTVMVMALDRVSFNSLLGPLREVLDHNLNMRVLENIKLFSNLTERERNKVSRSFEFETFAENTTIVREGDKGRKFYILKEGSAKVVIGGEEVGKLETGQYFGEMALLDDEVRKASVISMTNCECFVLDRPTFNRILGSLQSILERETADRMTALKSVTNADSNEDKFQLEMKDLNSLALLGSGTFGRVSLVQNKLNKTQVYALKAMYKSEIIMHHQQVNVLQEKKIMMSCNHPFILKLFCTYKDKIKLYMLLEFVQGGELFTVIHTPQKDGVSVTQAKFYSAGVLLGLSYMHSNDIAYRDMKPENCLVDRDGYPKLVDFGFAKVIKNSKSYTLCGTPEYLAPEIVLGRGHDKAVDLWALGILIFEMIAGYSPFSDPQGMDQVVICRNIVNGRLIFPRNFDNDCKELIKRLLQRDPITRLGNLRGGSDEIKAQPWYNNFNFDAMMNRQLKAPWLPTVTSLTDTSNFDPITEEVPDSLNKFVDNSNWDADF